MTEFKRSNVQSGAPWEAQVGYSRAVRLGRFIAISGSAAIDAGGQLVGEGDMYAQAKQCIAVIESALEKAGGRLADVVRTRTFVTDIERWAEVGRAHQEAFGEVMPATSMVEVSRLIDSRMLVEIEADAIIGDD
ncbi:MAG: RidA family protein [Gammaproteobacteria bacterium]|jgi:enamine deaminase RidA (YjgF/YER057c/UK114 family)|nr:RidA family protein [Gammaproteobacteria bacterium]MDH3846910.1 RidA family protein [Gammaproteobacteria bacterium]MDH3864116.1 RidA family protein [Gammaproteobacteria bacterium]MDH3905588.1 RidA family protein [Gammaproteobacteria bacterium]MDH4005582.1 RidA family protein [Gammaproteobacteria bacterium]